VASSLKRYFPISPTLELLLKVQIQVLRRSRGSEFDPALQNIYNSTIAVIFLGTPHRGSQIAPWGIIAKHIVAAVGFDTNARILRDLDMVSSALEFSKEEFSKILKLGTFQVCTFQEALGMKGMRGLNGKVSLQIPR
jgi:hypothetical protein